MSTIRHYVLVAYLLTYLGTQISKNMPNAKEPFKITTNINYANLMCRYFL